MNACRNRENQTFPTKTSLSTVPARRPWAFGHILISLAALTLSLGAASGCSRLRLPAIDPQGSSVFLPLPNTTGLNVPPLRSTPGQPGIIPTPAFTAPPTPPPCLDASNAGVCNLFGSDKHLLHGKLKDRLNARGKAGAIQLTPMKVVAPVGGEVVLLAGICGPDGYFVKREALEWMLSPNSVGTFIEVGDDHPGRLSSFLMHDPKVEKLDVDFARGRTSAKRTLITRGTPNCNDDIPLGEGQTWLSISSPSEGVSRVTVLAPDSEIWDQRRLTSTIYWVDAQWEFPAPVIRKSGETIQLVTRVTKAENLVPAENWIVEYTVLDPSIATFSPATGSNKASVRVNADGLATINLTSTPDGRGTTPIIIDVIRPADPADNLPQLVIGRGQTTATFSSPGLNLEVFGPPSGNVGSQLTYTGVLGNPGDLAAENVKLQLQIPSGTRLVQAVPEPTTKTPEYLIWDQGTLPANQQLDVSVVLEAQQPNTLRILFQAQGEGFPLRERSVTTQIIEPSVDVRFAPEGNVAEVEVGQNVAYEIDVRNSGPETLTNLKLEIETDEGLREYYQGANQVEQLLEVLRPGETRSVGVTFRVQQTGQLNAQLTISSGDRVLAQKTASIRGLPQAPKEPDIGVSIEFPERIQVGDQPQATITLRNPGEVKLSDIQVEVLIPPSLVARQVDTANASRIRMSEDRSVLTWTPNDLLPRSSGSSGDPIRQLRIALASQAEANDQIRVRASTGQGVTAEDSRSFQAIGIASPSNPPGGSVLPGDAPVLPSDGNTAPVLPSGPQQPGVTPPRGSGKLDVSLFDFDDPTVVGRELRYNLIVSNGRSTADRNVRIRLVIPQGVRLARISQDGDIVNYEFLEDGSVSLPDIRFLRPGEQVTYLFVVIPQIPQLMELKAQIFSDAQPEVETTSESTTVFVR